MPKDVAGKLTPDQLPQPGFSGLGNAIYIELEVWLQCVQDLSRADFTEVQVR